MLRAVLQGFLQLLLLALAAPAGDGPPPMRIGACCTPEPDLRLPAAVGAPLGANRASWVKARCTCLHDGLLAARNATVGAGEYRHFHWTLSNHSLIEVANGVAGGGEGRVTFLLTPCRGRAHLFVKPALLRDGRRMDQLFETEPGSGAPTPTWPFPDNRTGVTAQPPDADLQAGAGAAAGGLPTEKWGLAARDAGYENALTFRVAHGGFMVSVYGESESDFQLAALTHVGATNPLQRASEGLSRARRLSLAATWTEGQLALTWNTSGAAADDSFQLYMLKSPARGVHSGAQRRGICGVKLNDLPNGRSSRCIMSTPCGVLSSAQPVGRALHPISAKLIGGPLEVRLRDHGIEVEDEAPYFFTVLRTPADFPASPRELYVGLDTSSSYERVKQIFPDEVVGTIAAGVAGAIWLLCLYIARLKRKVQLKLYMVYQDAGSATGAA